MASETVPSPIPAAAAASMFTAAFHELRNVVCCQDVVSLRRVNSGIPSHVRCSERLHRLYNTLLCRWRMQIASIGGGAVHSLATLGARAAEPLCYKRHICNLGEN
jgi:hypothetical protein